MVNFIPAATALDPDKIDEIIRKIELRSSAAARYGWHPIFILAKMLAEGGYFLNETYYEEPCPSPQWTEYVICDINQDQGVTRSEEGITLYGAAEPTYGEGIAAVALGLTSYTRVLILCGVSAPSAAGVEAAIYLESQTSVFPSYAFKLSLAPYKTSADLTLSYLVGGDETVMAAESVDLSPDTPQWIAWYYDKRSQRHIVWRNGEKKFDVVYTGIYHIEPTTVWLALHTTNSSVYSVTFYNPIIILAV